MRIPDLLMLQHWLSPAFPLSSFAYSHGLETEIAAGRITNSKVLTDWLDGVLLHGAGRNDALLIRAAADRQVEEAEALALALCPSAGRVRELRDQGRAFQTTTSAIWGGADQTLTFPVAFGAALTRHTIPVSPAIAVYLQALVANLASAAIRLVPLGQTEGQAAVAALAGRCEAVARATEGQSLDDLGAAAFSADIASMQHETLEPRVFRT